MNYPKVSLESWLNKYPDLEVVSRDCDACGKIIRATIPFMSKDYVGLEAPRCTCGKNKFSCAVSITRTRKAHLEWSCLASFLDKEDAEWFVEQKGLK